MANTIQFEGKSGNRGAGCLECEANLTDALDGTLSAADQASFDAHIATCATCSQMLDEATRGAAWLEMLKMPRPEPRAALLEKILAQTSGAGLPERETDAEWSGYGMPVPNVPYGLPNYGISQPSLAQAFVPEMVASGKVLPFRARVAASSSWKSLRQQRVAATAGDDGGDGVLLGGADAEHDWRAVERAACERSGTERHSAGRSTTPARRRRGTTGI